jgi:hypothetical protein
MNPGPRRTPPAHADPPERRDALLAMLTVLRYTSELRTRHTLPDLHLDALADSAITVARHLGGPSRARQPRPPTPGPAGQPGPSTAS